MDLKEIIPPKVSFKLQAVPGDLTLNHVSLEDGEWLKQQYSDEELDQIFNEPRAKDILKIACRLLTADSKRALAKVNVPVFDDAGNEIKSDTPLPLDVKLHRICSQGEFMLIYSCIAEIRLTNMRIIAKIGEAMQKKTEEILGLANQSGKQSST